MHPEPRTPLADIATGLFAGLVATQVTDFAQRPLQWMTPASVDRQEKRVRPGESSSLVAAKRVADYLNLSPTQQHLAMLAKVIHYSVGMTWGPVYNLLRRYAGLGPFAASVTTGATMSLFLDGGIVPVVGLSASNRDYPAFTHVRGLLAHLVYGAAVALVTEEIGRLVLKPESRPGAERAVRAEQSAGDRSTRGAEQTDDTL